jgi:PIN domain nuclease of toxin-antitoxin system
MIGQAQSKEAVRISTATLFEIVALHTAGRLRLAQPLEQWINESLAGPACVSPS